MINRRNKGIEDESKERELAGIHSRARGFLRAHNGIRSWARLCQCVRRLGVFKLERGHAWLGPQAQGHDHRKIPILVSLARNGLFRARSKTCTANPRLYLTPSSRRVSLTYNSFFLNLVRRITFSEDSVSLLICVYIGSTLLGEASSMLTSNQMKKLQWNKIVYLY